jgi:flagellar biosynthetic protein FlhB
MSEQRTQRPSKRRRKLARQHGQVAQSPELTAAVGWLTAVVLLGAFGDDLAAALVKLARGCLVDSPVVSAGPAEVVAHVRGLVLGLAWPLGVIVASFAAGALAAHQLQVRGLWATRLIVPDPARLWALSSGPGLAFRAQRTAWAVAKVAVLIVAATWVIYAGWAQVLRLSGLEGVALAHAAGRIVFQLALVLAAVLLVLGLADYALRYRQFEAMLRTTPQEQREDQRVMEGDIVARAQRRRLARAWRGDAPDLLTGASLVVTGPAGLTLVLAGGPPPRRIAVRGIVSGNTGLRLRQRAQASNVPQVDAPHLARRLARRPTPGSPITAKLVAEIAAVWPPT